MRLAASLPGRTIRKTDSAQGIFSWSAGIGMLVPGLTQLNWGQHERGLVLLVSFLAAMASSLFCWGNPMGWAFLAFAFMTHAASTLDLIRQRSFPVFPHFMAVLATVGWLALAGYVPLGTLLTLFAFPAHPDGPAGVGYLVNRLAYRASAPSQGHFVWMKLSPESAPRAGRVIAVAGQEVEWKSRHWEVDGWPITSPPFDLARYSPDRYQFRVPERHLLIGLENDSSRLLPCGPMVLISQEQVVGRIWACYSPFWDRRLL